MGTVSQGEHLGAIKELQRRSDTIEALRAENERLRHDRAHPWCCVEVERERDTLRAENERLRQFGESISDEATVYQEQREALRQQVADLREAGEYLAAVLLKLGPGHWVYDEWQSRTALKETEPNQHGS